MALLVLTLEDIGQGLIRINSQCDVDIDTAPVTPAMLAMAKALDTIMALNILAEQTLDAVKERMH